MDNGRFVDFCAYFDTSYEQSILHVFYRAIALILVRLQFLMRRSRPEVCNIFVQCS